MRRPEKCLSDGVRWAHAGSSERSSASASATLSSPRDRLSRMARAVPCEIGLASDHWRSRLRCSGHKFGDCSGPFRCRRCLKRRAGQAHADVAMARIEQDLGTRLVAQHTDEATAALAGRAGPGRLHLRQVGANVAVAGGRLDACSPSRDAYAEIAFACAHVPFTRSRIAIERHVARTAVDATDRPL